MHGSLDKGWQDVFLMLNKTCLYTNLRPERLRSKMGSLLSFCRMLVRQDVDVGLLISGRAIVAS